MSWQERRALAAAVGPARRRRRCRGKPNKVQVARSYIDRMVSLVKPFNSCKSVTDERASNRLGLAIDLVLVLVLANETTWLDRPAIENSLFESTQFQIVQANFEGLNYADAI